MRRVADRHREDAAGRLDRVSLPRPRLASPRIDRADRVLVEVQREAERAALELEQLVDRGVGQAGDARDAVTDLEHLSDAGLVERRRERVDVLAERRRDLVDESMVSSGMTFLHLFEAVTDGAVDDGVADAGDEAAHHARVDDRPSPRRSCRSPGRAPSARRSRLRRVQRDRGLRTSATSRLRSAAASSTKRSTICASSPRAWPAATSIESNAVLTWRAPCRPMSSSMTAMRRSTGSAGSVSASRSSSDALHGPREAEQVVLDLRRGALAARDLEQRLGVRLDLRALVSRLLAPASLPLPTELM